MKKMKIFKKYLNEGTNTITIEDEEGKNKVTYFIEPWIREKFDTKVIPDLKKKDKDSVICIDGSEGSGKSTLGLQLCRYVDPTFNLSRVVFTPEEFRDAIYKAKKGQAIMFDEAFTGFSSRASLSGVNKTLVSLMMQLRQKNLFIAIVLPTIFLLDKYISLFRTRVLIHVYEVRGRRGFYKVYSSRKKKELIFNKKAKVYSYGVNTKLRGRFYGVFALGGEDEEKAYRKKKEVSLKKSEQNMMTSSGVKYRMQRDVMVFILRKELKLSYKKIESLLSSYDFDISYVQIRSICIKFGDKEVLDENKTEKSDVDTKK